MRHNNWDDIVIGYLVDHYTCHLPSERPRETAELVQRLRMILSQCGPDEIWRERHQYLLCAVKAI
jgi:hypothetical protein